MSFAKEKRSHWKLGSSFYEVSHRFDHECFSFISHSSSEIEFLQIKASMDRYFLYFYLSGEGSLGSEYFDVGPSIRGENHVNDSF